jgi:thymidylate synthase (FAD)
MKVIYIDHMGYDISVVNSARVSFDVKHEKFEEEKDTKLINYLASHKHEIPFAHTAITLYMEAPIYIRTQCFKHKVGFVENEVSRRYVASEPEFFTPKDWRLKADNKKQGSSDEVYHDQTGVNIEIEDHHKNCLHLYNDLIDMGICPEQARGVLPQSTYTKWYWTGSLLAFARFYNLRTDSHAQKEIQDLAYQVGKIINPLFPVSWNALTQKNPNKESHTFSKQEMNLLKDIMHNRKPKEPSEYGLSEKEYIRFTEDLSND